MSLFELAFLYLCLFESVLYLCLRSHAYIGACIWVCTSILTYVSQCQCVVVVLLIAFCWYLHYFLLVAMPLYCRRVIRPSSDWWRCLLELRCGSLFLLLRPALRLGPLVYTARANVPCSAV